MKQIIIDLDNRSYPIYIGKGIAGKISELFRQHRINKQIALITDRNVSDIYLKTFVSRLEKESFEVFPIIIPAGEKQKSWIRLSAVVNELVKMELPRNAAIAALGGGVVGDLAGFASAMYRRGINFIQIPTTLLSQLDSSIGGKVGVNFLDTKNVVGAFHQPKFVVSDVLLLKTLHKREIVCGIGEMLKYGILSGNEMFNFLSENVYRISQLDEEVIEETIFRCATIKAKMVSEDEKELSKEGGRVPLNIGHAVGHALEALSNYRLHHGEAVLLGLKIESEIARELKILPEKEFKRIIEFLNGIKFKPDISYIQISNILRYLAEGKGGQKTRFVLPKRIGQTVVTQNVPTKIIEMVLRKYLI